MNHEERVVKPRVWRTGAPLLVPRNSSPSHPKADFAVILSRVRCVFHPAAGAAIIDGAPVLPS